MNLFDFLKSVWLAHSKVRIVSRLGNSEFVHHFGLFYAVLLQFNCESVFYIESGESVLVSPEHTPVWLGVAEEAPELPAAGRPGDHLHWIDRI